MSDEENVQTDDIEKLPVDEEIPEDHDDREAELKYEEDPNKVEEEEAEE